MGSFRQPKSPLCPILLRNASFVPQLSRAGLGAPQLTLRAAKREVPRLDKTLDDHLSNRWIDLDEKGYFIVTVDRAAKQIVAEHYKNTINKDGQACDPGEMSFMDS